jgi:hypothetical protein
MRRNGEKTVKRPIWDKASAIVASIMRKIKESSKCLHKIAGSKEWRASHKDKSNLVQKDRVKNC